MSCQPLHRCWELICPRRQETTLPHHGRSVISSSSSSVVFCTARYWHPLYLHPSVSATKPPSFAKSCSIWILLLPLVGLPFILPSVISCKSPSCLKTLPIHRCFLCRIEFSICLSSFTVLRTSLLVTVSCQLIRRLNKYTDMHDAADNDDDAGDCSLTGDRQSEVYNERHVPVWGMFMQPRTLRRPLRMWRLDPRQRRLRCSM